MARKKIREYDGKKLLKAHLQRLAGLSVPIQVVQVTSGSNFIDLIRDNPWLSTTKLVVKPDMLFGQRGKNDLVGINLDHQQAEEFILQRMNKSVTINGCIGPVNTFLVEPFVPHTEEYYLSIQSLRTGYQVNFSEKGGVHVEEHWDEVKSVLLAADQDNLEAAVAPLIAGFPLELRGDLERFLVGCVKVFIDLDMSFLEMNPFTLDANNKPFPLDCRAELDDTAGFRNGDKWGAIDFPLPFGRIMSSAEEKIHGLDEQTGASLKFTVLNPSGRVWLMVAGGGASVIFADTVGDLGAASELGNYGEYSGAPNTQETYQYARTVLSCATANYDGRGRALLIGGGIANFTDVAATFTGIIMALREQADALKACKFSIFVRRGGPNYAKGLELMRQLGQELQLPIHVYGPEASMTGICKEAIDYISTFN